MYSYTLLPSSVGPVSSSGHCSCHDHGGGVVHARTGAARERQVVINQEDRAEMDHEFREERDKTEEYFKKIINASVSRSEATAFRGYLCRIAKSSVRLASVVMGEPSDISPHTLLSKPMTPTNREKMVLEVCVRTFVSTAEDACYDKVTKETIVCFLGALERLAAMSYFMAQDTLANVGDYKIISVNCGPYFDVDRDRFKYMRKMATVKHYLNTAQLCDAERVLMYTVSDAMTLTEPFVISMSTCRRNAFRGLMPGVRRAAAV